MGFLLPQVPNAFWSPINELNYGLTSKIPVSCLQKDHYGLDIKNDAASLNVSNCCYVDLDLKWRHGIILCEQIPANDCSLN